MKNIIKKLIRYFGFEIKRFQPEESDAAMIKKLIDVYNIDLVLDVGANIGQFSRELRVSGYNGKMVSFEPLLDAHKLLSENAIKDKNWIVAPRMAIGENVGEMTINVSENSYSSSLLPMLRVHFKAAPDSHYIGSEKINVTTLDLAASQYLEDKNHIYLKIDTQGFEDKIIKGGGETLSKTEIVQIELSLVPLYEGQLLFLDIISILSEIGFELCGIIPVFIDNETGNLLQFDGVFKKIKCTGTV